MENFEQFRAFKTQKCPESLCPCYKQTSSKQKPLNGYAECFYYHNADDKRRDPFDNSSPPALLYTSDFSGNKYIKLDPEDCQNEIEYLYHPFEFKVKACSVCYGDFCPNYHDNDDRDFWKKILKEYRELQFAESRISMNKSSNEGNRNSSGNDSKFSNDNTLNLSHHGESNTVLFENFLDENLEEEHHNKDSFDKPILKEHTYQNNNNSKASSGGESEKSKQQQHSGNQNNTKSFSGQFFIENSNIKSESKEGFSGQFYMDESDRKSQDSTKNNEKRIINIHKDEDKTIYNKPVPINIEKRNVNNDTRDSREEEKSSSSKNTPIMPINIKDYSTSIQLPPALNGYVKTQPRPVHINTQAKKAESPQSVNINQTPKPEPRVQNLEATESQWRAEKKRETDLNLLGILNSKNGLPFTIGTKIYTYKEVVDVAENMHHEFKHFKVMDIGYLETLIEKYVTSFLNSQGGTLYLGIDDRGHAFGVRLDRKMFDEIAITFDRKLKHFTPPVRADQYQIRANYIYDKKNGLYIKDHYIIEIEIKKGDPSDLYFNDKKDSFIRKQASSIVLQPAAIKDEIIARTKRQMSRNLVGLLKDSGFEESLKRQSKTDLEDIKTILEQKIKFIEHLILEDEGAYDEHLKKLERL